MCQLKFDLNKTPWEVAAMFVMESLNSLLEAGKEIGNAIVEIKTRQEQNKAEIDKFSTNLQDRLKNSEKSLEDKVNTVNTRLENYIRQQENKSTLSTTVKVTIACALVTGILGMVGVILTIIF